MYAYILGKVTHRDPASVIIEAGGIGYRIHITLASYTRIGEAPEVKLWLHQHVKDDGFSLYGFFEQEERDLFVQLISVSGVGPNTARIILSSMSPEEVRSAVSTNDVQRFKGVKGVGPKTAQRIIIDLRDKIGRGATQDMLILDEGNTTFIEESLSALTALGFSRPKIQQVINKIRRSDPSIDNAEAMIKTALGMLS